MEMEFLEIVVRLSCAYILQSHIRDCSVHAGIPQLGFSFGGVVMYFNLLMP